MVDKAKTLLDSDKKLEHDQDQAYLNLILHYSSYDFSKYLCELFYLIHGHYS